MPSLYWQQVKDLDFSDVPDTYLDWLMGQEWFLKKWTRHAEKVTTELATRRRSNYHVPDRFGKILGD